MCMPIATAFGSDVMRCECARAYGNAASRRARVATLSSLIALQGVRRCGPGKRRSQSTAIRSLFLRLFGAIYVVAFVSYWLQYPGLYGVCGLEPAEEHWRNVMASPRARAAGYFKIPSFLWFRTATGSVSIDAIMEGTAVVGAVLGSLAVAGVHHASVFAAAFVCYLSLFISGQTFLSFQWDIFLLETGATAVLYAPWWSIHARGPLPHVAWVLRVQWVKFMLMSGVVKVRANGPTWQDLSALQFHFASTCLPTAEAWWFHSLPPFMHSLGIAAMFVFELFAPWLLLVPIRAVRQFGVLLQVPFQASIMLTGNYCWFNLHTAILLLPAWDTDVDDVRLPERTHTRNTPSSCFDVPRVITTRWERAWNSAVARAAACAVAALGLARCAWAYFPITLACSDDSSASNCSLGFRDALFAPDALRINNRVTTATVNGLLAAVLDWRAVAALYVVVALAVVTHAATPVRDSFDKHGWLRRVAWRLGSGAVVLVALGVTLQPLGQFAGRDVAIPAPFVAPVARLAAALRPFRASSQYGLFRRMTGVGRAAVPRTCSADGNCAAESSWGGTQLRAVEVPAVVVELSWDEGNTWTELPFKYAPFVESRAPRRTAPHQPRLDWQMWFAALAPDYSSNPWLVRMVWSILLGGGDEVVALFDTNALPRLLDTDAPPSNVRASLYHYDFTRAPWSEPWVSRVPGGLARIAVNATRNAWWSRRRVREFLPAVNRAMLAGVAKRQQWPLTRPPRNRERGSAVARALRGFVGVSGSSRWTGDFFLDGSLLIVTAAVALPLALRSTAACWRQCSVI